MTIHVYWCLACMTCLYYLYCTYTHYLLATLCDYKCKVSLCTMTRCFLGSLIFAPFLFLYNTSCTKHLKSFHMHCKHFITYITVLLCVFYVHPCMCPGGVSMLVSIYKIIWQSNMYVLLGRLQTITFLDWLKCMVNIITCAQIHSSLFMHLWKLYISATMHLLLYGSFSIWCISNKQY